MNEQITNPEFHAMQAKASEISLFLNEHLSKMPSEKTALLEGVGIKEDSRKSNLLGKAMDSEGYISQSKTDRDTIDDMYQSLKNAVEGEESN